MRSACLGLLDKPRQLPANEGKKAYLRPVLETKDCLAHPEIVALCVNSKLLAAAAGDLGELAALSAAQLFWRPGKLDRSRQRATRGAFPAYNAAHADVMSASTKRAIDIDSRRACTPLRKRLRNV
jgi:hypothetical protein